VPSERVERRLAAILAGDVAGYSRLMGVDEEGTLRQLKAHRKELVDPKITEHRGRIVKTTGDGMLVEFVSVVDAVRCAVEIQRGMVERNNEVPAEKRIRFRIGINVGDIISDGNDIYGDGVNVAARLEGLAEPGGICVSRVVHDQVRDKLSFSFEDMGEQSVKNIARPIGVHRVNISELAAPAGSTPSTPHPHSDPTVSTRPSIAVLPFQNMSGDLEQDHFCDGLVEDIITTLSKLAGLRVIARNSSFVYKGRSVDVREAANQLGVRYVLEGSVRKSGNRIRVTTQLIDASDGSHLWAERYDRTIDDIFAIQDEITLVLADQMRVKLTEGEEARLHYTTTHNVEAWTCWVQGLAHYRGMPTRENFGAVRRHWEKALALDPTSASLNAMLGFVHVLDARFGWWDERETALGKARRYAETALERERDNADAYRVTSILLLIGGRYEEAAADARKSVDLAPGSADVAEVASFVLASSGCPEEAVTLAENAIALNPNHPPLYLGILGNAYRLSGRVEEAIDAFKAYHARHPGFGLTDLVIAYHEMGQAEEAKQAAKRLLAARPAFTIASWQRTQFRRDTARLEADLAALRAAGLPQG
jgi:adenylate cyclase